MTGYHPFRVTDGRHGAVPHTYVTCTRDNTVPIALQRRFITEIDAVSQAPTTVVELDSSHSPFLSQPAALAATSQDLLHSHPERIRRLPCRPVRACKLRCVNIFELSAFTCFYLSLPG